jgi:hypothetical protein
MHQFGEHVVLSTRHESCSMGMYRPIGAVSQSSPCSIQPPEDPKSGCSMESSHSEGGSFEHRELSIHVKLRMVEV